MSGGSYDYLYRKPVGEALDSGYLDRAARTLATLNRPDASKAASDLDRVLQIGQRLSDDLSALSGVLRALEWNESSDWGLELDDALRLYADTVKL